MDKLGGDGSYHAFEELSIRARYIERHKSWRSYQILHGKYPFERETQFSCAILRRFESGHGLLSRADHQCSQPTHTNYREIHAQGWATLSGPCATFQARNMPLLHRLHASEDGRNSLFSLCRNLVVHHLSSRVLQQFRKPSITQSTIEGQFWRQVYSA